MSRIEKFLIVFNTVFFAIHLLAAGVGFRKAKDRNRRLEAIGAVVPGLAGVLLILAIYAPCSWAKVLLLLMAIPLIVIGRAMYELVVFSFSTNKLTASAAGSSSRATRPLPAARRRGRGG